MKWGLIFTLQESLVCSKKKLLNWVSMEGFERYGKKRVMVVVDHTSNSKHAMLWALTHVANKGDLVTLLHIVSHSTNRLSEMPSDSSSSSSFLANSLGYLCKASRPEVLTSVLIL